MALFDSINQLTDNQKQETIKHARNLFNDKEKLKELRSAGVYIDLYCEALEHVVSAYCIRFNNY